MTPLRHSGRVLWPRVLQGMVAMALACALLVPAAIAAEPSGPGAAQPAGAPGATIREVTVSKSPYNTTIQASVDGAIENYNSFKLNDPFRIVVDVWGVAQGTAASEIPVGTPEVKAVKISSVDRKLRMVVETPGDRPMPFIVSAEKGMLVLSVGGGAEEKVTSTERLQDGKAPVKGPAVVGIDLEDLPDASNVVITTAGDPPYQVSKKAGGVTLVFKGAVAEKGLLRRIDARKFDIPVKAIAPSGGKKGITVAVAFAPGSPYTVEKRDGSVVVAFPKGAAEGKTDLVARAAPGSAPADGEGGRGTGGHGREGGTGAPRGFADVGIPHREFRRRPEIPRAADLHGLQGCRPHQRFPDHRRGQQPEHHHVGRRQGEGLPPAGQRSVGSGARHRPPLEVARRVAGGERPPHRAALLPPEGGAGPVRRAEAGRAVASGGAEPGRRGQDVAGGGLRHHPGQLQQGVGTAGQDQAARVEVRETGQRRPDERAHHPRPSEANRRDEGPGRHARHGDAAGPDRGAHRRSGHDVLPGTRRPVGRCLRGRHAETANTG